jgi:two-component system, sensor histidine kinase
MPKSANYHDIAVTRARDVRARTALGVFITATSWYVTQSAWALAWFAAFMATQAISVAVGRPMQKDARRVPTRARAMGFLASIGFSAAVFASISALVWYQGGLEGRLFAFVVLMGGMLNIALQAQSHRTLFWVGCLPFMPLIVGLPLSTMLLEPQVHQGAMAFVVAGGILYIGHVVVAVRQNDKSSAALRSALHQAKSDRLRADQANKAKSEFLATMSHEIRTPLNGVLGMAQAMEAEPLPPKQKDRLDVVRQSGEVLLMLLNDLLDISKIESNRLELEDGVVDVEELAEQARAAFAPICEAKGVRLKVWVSDAAKDLRRGDPVRVRQIIYNLLSNAVKFTAEGRVGLHISANAEELVIEVTDSGAGIPAEVLLTLFERFTQADATTTRRYGGSGLGLSISRALARLMNGDITVESAMGVGSTFTARIALPAAEGLQRPPREAPKPVRVAPHKTKARSKKKPKETDAALRILAAEDNATNRLVLRTLLEQVGLYATFVENGREALEAWRKGRWDVILMDIQMPEMDGVAATREIRREEAEKGLVRTPIVALTANAMAHQTSEYTAAGMDGLAPKPIQLPQLIGVLETVLEPAEEQAAAKAS